jgi:hypothetical protein
MDYTQEIREITQQDLASLGVQQIAYIKPIVEDGHRGYAIHAADGTRMGVMESREQAFAAVRQHDLEPFSVH